MFGKIFGGGAKTATVKILPAEVSFTVEPGKTILISALDQKLKYPHYCRVGSCGTCKSKLVEGAVRELTDKSYTLSAEEVAAGYILACQSIPKGDVVVEVPKFRNRPAEGQKPVEAEV